MFVSVEANIPKLNICDEIIIKENKKLNSKTIFQLCTFYTPGIVISNSCCYLLLVDTFKNRMQGYNFSFHKYLIVCFSSCTPLPSCCSVREPCDLLVLLMCLSESTSLTPPPYAGYTTTTALKACLPLTAPECRQYKPPRKYSL